MRIGYVQFNPVFGEVQHNLDALEQLISPVDSDILVLPELAFTGYAFNSLGTLNSLAENVNRSTSLDFLHDLARRINCGLVVGFPESAGDAIYNSSVFLNPDGSRELYRKIHLFGAENLLFTPGDLPFRVFEFRGATLGMMICFDWFFPESARTLALLGAQVICHAVNFVLPWGPDGCRIRSLENHVYMVTANRYGREQIANHELTFIGKSQIVSPHAETLAAAPAIGDHVAVIDIDPADASDKTLNKYSNLFETRRPEFYKGIAGE